MQKQIGYTLKNVFVFNYAPRVYENRVESRKMSTFMYIREGEYHYRMGEKGFSVQAGEVVYVPKGAVYSFSVAREMTERIQVEFDLEMANSLKPVVLTDEPTKAYDPLFSALFSRLFGDYCDGKEFELLADLYEIIALFSSKRGTDGTSDRLRPAISYIRQNINRKIGIGELAQACRVSESHLRRLFDSQFGMSPLQYKNRVILQNACRMLEAGVMNVSEIADALGFADIYGFSRFFKKQIGLSPVAYRAGLNP